MRLLPLAFTLLPTLAAAQDAPSFLPLTVGNSWTYASRVPTSPTTWETHVYDPWEVSGTTTINDTVYTEVDYPFALGTLHRLDAEGRVWTRLGGRDQLLFDVAADDAETYAFPEPGTEYVYTVTVSRDVTVETFAGPFDGAIQFSFDIPEVFDDDRSFILAPGIGVVAASASLPAGGDASLYAASVDGRVVVSTATGPEAERLAAAAPNPLARATTITLPPGPPAHVRVDVVDLLGRRIVTLLDGRVGADGRTIDWPARGVPPGVYLARVHRGGRTQTLRLVVTR